MRTEPWLAHPTASASASTGEGTEHALTRYAIKAPSVLHWEAPARSKTARGTLTRVDGEISVDFGDLSRSRARIRADLESLTIDEPEGGSGALLQAQIRRALDLADGAAPASTSFDLTALEDLPSELEGFRGSAGAPLTRRLRATAVGDLLLHGFRVVRRVPVEAEFGFANASAVASTLVIRSRAPVVISLETHAITVPPPETPRKSSAGTPSTPREVRVSIELYATKMD